MIGINVGIPAPVASLPFGGMKASQFADIKARMNRLTESDLPSLRKDLDAAGVPWTPGRGVPAE